MNEAAIDFIKVRYIPLLRKAEPTKPPNWGKMSFQQMVEHMVLAVKNSNGKLKAEKILVDSTRLPALREFLHSDKEFRENTKSPAFPDEPLALHFQTAEEAIDKLEKELAYFFEVFQAQPRLEITNPVFGDLDFEMSTRLLYKHAVHHLRQFSLI